MTFKEAIKLFNSRSEMCDVLGVTRQAVSIWSKNPDKPLPKVRQWQLKAIQNGNEKNI